MGSSSSSLPLPGAEDYDIDDNWAWLPSFSGQKGKEEWDPALCVPSQSLVIGPGLVESRVVAYASSDSDSTATSCDVFYVHPTTHLVPSPFVTNNSIASERIDTSHWHPYNIRSCLKHHASVFASRGNAVYAPFYKSASIRMYNRASNLFDNDASANGECISLCLTERFR